MQLNSTHLHNALDSMDFCRMPHSVYRKNVQCITDLYVWGNYYGIVNKNLPNSLSIVLDKLNGFYVKNFDNCNFGNAQDFEGYGRNGIARSSNTTASSNSPINRKYQVQTNASEYTSTRNKKRKGIYRKDGATRWLYVLQREEGKKEYGFEKKSS